MMLALAPPGSGTDESGYAKTAVAELAERRRTTPARADVRRIWSGANLVASSVSSPRLVPRSYPGSEVADWCLEGAVYE